MTANELADLLMDFDSGQVYNHATEIATMLRQQQAEIEALKLQLHTTLTNRDLRTYDGKLDMNNEPVAWMLLGLEDRKPKLINLQVIEHLEGTWIPLYTHPADESFDRTASHMAGEYVSYPSKDLTDEEIIEIWSGMETDTGEQNIAFARAILRKAQEK